jgi:hypothetical protein
VKRSATRSIPEREAFCIELQELSRRLAVVGDERVGAVDPDELYQAEADVFACVDLYRESLLGPR